MSEPEASVVYREGILTAADYGEAIMFLQEVKSQLEANAGYFCPCGDACSPGRCYHDPLVMARRAADDQCRFRCFHCGEVFTTDEAAREHFGEKQDALTACLKDTAKLIALMKAAVLIAIVRSGLVQSGFEEDDLATDWQDQVAADAADAVRAIGTCDETPLPEWLAFFSKEAA